MVIISSLADFIQVHLRSFLFRSPTALLVLFFIPKSWHSHWVPKIKNSIFKREFLLCSKLFFFLVFSTFVYGISICPELFGVKLKKLFLIYLFPSFSASGLLGSFFKIYLLLLIISPAACFSQLFIIVIKRPKKNRFKGGKLILAHGFRSSIYGWPTP